TINTMYIGDKEIPLKGRPCGVNYLGKYYFSDGEKLKVYGKFDNEASTYCKLIGTPITDYEVYDVVSPPVGHARLGTEHTRGVDVIDYTNKKVYYEPCENEYLDPLKGENKIPDIVKYVVTHRDRLFLAGHTKEDDTIFYSDKLNGLYFPSVNFTQLPPTSDKITGI